MSSLKITPMEEIVITSLSYLSYIVIPLQFIHYVFFGVFLFSKDDISSINVDANIKYLKNNTNQTTETKKELLGNCKQYFISFVQPVVYSSMMIPLGVLLFLLFIGTYVLFSAYSDYINKRKRISSNGSIIVKGLLIILPFFLLFSFPTMAPLYAPLHRYILNNFIECTNLIQSGNILYESFYNMTNILSIFYFEYSFYVFSFVIVLFLVSIYTLAFKE